MSFSFGNFTPQQQPNNNQQFNTQQFNTQQSNNQQQPDSVQFQFDHFQRPAIQQNTLNDPDRAFKVVVIGDGGTGKTTFVRRHLDGSYERKYVATIGVDVSPMTFYTNFGKKRLTVWDTAGQEKFAGMKDGYYIQADAAILFFDCTSRTTYTNVSRWYTDLVRVVGTGVPIVLVGNKIDVKDRKVKPKMITFHRKKNIQYFEVSCKANYNIEKPFVHILRRLVSPELQLVKEPAYPPAEIPIDMERARKMNEEINSLPPLPEEEEEI